MTLVARKDANFWRDGGGFGGDMAVDGLRKLEPAA